MGTNETSGRGHLSYVARNLDDGFDSDESFTDMADNVMSLPSLAE